MVFLAINHLFPDHIGLCKCAALRELFKSKSGNNSVEVLPGTSERDIGWPQEIDLLAHELPSPRESEKDDGKLEVQHLEEVGKNEKETLLVEDEKQSSARASLMGLNDASDEFFDVPEETEETSSELSMSDWSAELSPQRQSMVITNRARLIFQMNVHNVTNIFDGRPLQNTVQPKLSSAAGFVKKLHDLAGKIVILVVCEIKMFLIHHTATKNQLRNAFL